MTTQKKEDSGHQSDQSVSNPSKWLKKLTMILASVLLLTMFGLGGYWLGARQQQSSSTDLLTKPKPIWLPTITPIGYPSSAPTADPILEWNTYVDKSYSYEFKYPLKWIANRCGSTVFFLDYKSSCATEPLGYVTISVRPATQPSPQFVDYEQSSWEVRDVQEITVGNVKGAKALLQKKEAAPGPERFLVVRLIHNRNELTITLFKFQEIQTFDRILSTFHFIK